MTRRVLWITLLALKDQYHIARATVPWLAQTCQISVEQVEEYLQKFQAPDKYSRSQEHEGRRIEAVEEGWRILNGQKYREKMSKDDRREQIRKAVAKHREKEKSGVTVRAAGSKKYPANVRELGPVGKGRACARPNGETK